MEELKVEIEVVEQTLVDNGQMVAWQTRLDCLYNYYEPAKVT